MLLLAEPAEPDEGECTETLRFLPTGAAVNYVLLCEIILMRYILLNKI